MAVSSRKLITESIKRNIKEKYKNCSKAAEAMGITRQELNRWTTGTTFLSAEKIDLIASTLEIPAAALLATEKEQAAMDIGLHIQENQKLERLVIIASDLSDQEIDTLIKVAEMAKK